MNVSLKIPNIAIAVGAVVVVIGTVLFHDDGEGPMQAVGAVGFIVMLGTLIVLGLREEKRERQEGRRPQ